MYLLTLYIPKSCTAKICGDLKFVMSIMKSYVGNSSILDEIVISNQCLKIHKHKNR